MPWIIGEEEWYGNLLLDISSYRLPRTPFGKPDLKSHKIFVRNASPQYLHCCGFSVSSVMGPYLDSDSDSKTSPFRSCAATSLYILTIYPTLDYKHYNCREPRHLLLYYSEIVVHRSWFKACRTNFFAGWFGRTNNPLLTYVRFGDLWIKGKKIWTWAHTIIVSQTSQLIIRIEERATNGLSKISYLKPDEGHSHGWSTGACRHKVTPCFIYAMSSSVHTFPHNSCPHRV